MKHFGGLGFVLLLIGIVCNVYAESQPVEIRFNFGKAAFLDENTPFDHTVFGASVRIYLTERLAIEPEFAYMKGPGSDRDYLIFPNVSYDLLQSEKGSIYVIGGAGLLHHTEKFPLAQDPDFSGSEWTATGGLGGKFFVSDHLFVGGDFRFGWEPLYRISAGVGYRF